MMRATTIGTLAATLTLSAFLTGCPKDSEESSEPMTLGEAREALEESQAESEAASLQQNTVEISTNFTIGKAVKDAAGELKTFIQTQLPCAEITLVDATLSVTYGAKPGNCIYRGQKFSGTHVVKVEKNEDEIVVDHEWKEISNGKVKVTGTAHVTWDFDSKSRRVEYEGTWTRIADGRSGTGTGDITQTALPNGVTEGIQIDGSRSWTGTKGRWDLAVQGIQVRWVDPVPQAGTYRLASPKGRSLVLSFARVDGDTIAVTLGNDTKSFTFNVNALGVVAEK
ncbi:MAG: hypothetical protein KIT84_10775 [Labilithrix sp.]|nr:hypothetical protein [Labilithrix sp.]MCW5811490.1 hypothetical protein [Labilithrix sp.]